MLKESFIEKTGLPSEFILLESSDIPEELIEEAQKASSSRDWNKLAYVLQTAGENGSLYLLQSISDCFYDMREVGIWGRTFLQNYGRPGLDHFKWISRNLLGYVNRIGRLEFEPAPFPFAAVAGIHQGDAVIRIHVPQDGPLLPQSVDQALSQAKSKFGNFPFVCDSWLLDPLLKQLLREDSNIIIFQNHFNPLFPVPFSIPQIYERVFSFTTKTVEDVLSFKATTSLQKSVQTAISNGVRFSDTGGILNWSDGR